MQLKELIDEARNVFDDSEHAAEIMVAFDYLEALGKAADEKRIRIAVEKGVRNPKEETKTPYEYGYRAGWNDALHELSIDGGQECARQLFVFANKMKRK